MDNTSLNGAKTVERRTAKRSTGRMIVIGGLTAAAMLMLGSSEAWAETHGIGQGSSFVLSQQVASALHMTSLQIWRINWLRQDMLQDLANERAQLRQLRLQLNQAQRHPLWHALLIHRLNRQIDAVQDTIRERQAQYNVEVFRTLTPQQRALYRQMTAQNLPSSHAPRGYVANNGDSHRHASHGR